MARGRPKTKVLEDTVSSHIDRDGSVRIFIPKRVLREAGADPCISENIPDEFVLDYYKGGEMDGILEIDLKRLINDYQAETASGETAVAAADGGDEVL